MLLILLLLIQVLPAEPGDPTTSDAAGASADASSGAGPAASGSTSGSASSAAAVASDVPRVDQRFCLTYLLAPGEEKISAEILRLESLLESPDSPAPGDQKRIEYAAGVLRVYHYIRAEQRDDAMRAKELLESAAPGFSGEDLFTVHIGMAHAFVASIKTIFGVGDLKKMQSELQSIERDHSNWLIRFLRGITLYEVGNALPGVFTIREIKNEAIEVGEKDLRYVLDKPRLSEFDQFDPESYDYRNMPVPSEVVQKAEAVLAGK